MQGTVKYWNSDRGFGFIKADAVGDSVFLHITALAFAQLDEPEIGDRFEYEIEPARDGRLRAINLSKVD